MNTNNKFIKGCYCGAKPSEKYGRKTVIMINNIFFIVGGLLTAIGFLEGQ
jgi:hypothetical protein